MYGILGDNLVLIENYQKSVCLDRPMYLSVTILDTSKVLMQDFWYDCLRRKFLKHLRTRWNLGKSSKWSKETSRSSCPILGKIPVHISAAKKALELGVKLVGISKVVTFRQEAWLKPYIEFNTQQRQSTTSKPKVRFFKNMNNSFYGKTMENVKMPRIRRRLSSKWGNHFTRDLLTIGGVDVQQFLLIRNLLSSVMSPCTVPTMQGLCHISLWATWWLGTLLRDHYCFRY